MRQTRLSPRPEVASSSIPPESGTSTAPMPPPPGPSESGRVDTFEAGAGFDAGARLQRMSGDERLETLLRRVDHAFTHPATTAVVVGVMAGLGLATGLEVVQEGMSWAAGRELLTHSLLTACYVGASGTKPPAKRRPR